MSTILDKISNFLKHKNDPYGFFGAFKILSVTQAIGTEERDWSISHGGFDKLKFKGIGEKVAVLDTGADINHPDLKGQVETKCFIEGCEEIKDTCGHGTFCMGEIVGKEDGYGIIGVAPQATGLACKVLYGDGRDNYVFSFDKNLANAIRYSTDNGCGVISMSLGSSYHLPYTSSALEYAVEHGVIPFAASGNEGLFGSPYKSYPASDVNCISVAAANKKDLPAFFSTGGIGYIKEEQPEISVASLEYYWGCLPNNNYGKMIGTSMSCPTAAGVALLWREAMRNRGVTIEGKMVISLFRDWIKRVAKDTNKNGWDSDLGYGVLLLEDGDL